MLKGFLGGVGAGIAACLYLAGHVFISDYMLKAYGGFAGIVTFCTPFVLQLGVLGAIHGRKRDVNRRERYVSDASEEDRLS